MGTKLQYKISLAVSTGISLLFILLITLSSIYIEQANEPVIFIFIFISGPCMFFLFFNYLCHRLLKANKENSTTAGWILNYRKVILVFMIIALVIIAFMFIASAFTFITNYREFPSRQRPFFTIFLLFTLVLTVSGIKNSIYFFKALKQNKLIVNSVINTIGDNTAP